jgi:putative Holliday junction resolvase
MMAGHKKFLGLDYGERRIGLALAEEGSLALPYKILTNDSRLQLLRELQKIIQAENISLVVVGLPYSLSGQTNERLQITQEFVAWLKNNLDLEVATMDESFTSKMFSKMGVKKEIDKHSAAAILTSWLEKKNV